ncbi:MAG: M43 family zinc metalloprotease, partial [Leadbetterella sp.]|nr:M43 family zinc metalloprotease [Leadbetterella sp.]
MKKTILFSLILFYTFLSVSIKGYSQQCGFGAVFQAQVQQNPNLLNELAQSGNTLSNFNPLDEYLIPVVVHILHSGGPENISDDQVFRAIEMLNQDFHGDSDPDHLDTKIRFRLAQTDPFGCSTSGIIRIFQAKEPCILTGIYGSNPGGVTASTISYWPKEHYLNIWVVNCFDTQISAFAGLPTFGNPTSGIVIQHRYFGDIGTASNNFAPHVISHEGGHCFGLIHIWGPDPWEPHAPTWLNCHLESEGETNGDLVSDTPPQGVYQGDFGCEEGNNSCDIEINDRLDDIDNFMSYNTNCMRAFTPGQNTKFIQSRLFDAYNSLWSSIGNQCAGLVPPLFPTVVEITQNTTWTTANLPNNGIIIMDKITVKPGVTFTIGAGVEVHFRRCNQTSNFVIELNAKVILQGKLTNSLCNPTDYWYGVEVAGYNVLHFSAAPGEIIAEPGSEIEKAEYGIRNRAVINGIEYTGGKISAFGATFRNNKYGVRFYHYLNIDKPAPGPWSLPDDGAEFVDCLFTVNIAGTVPAAIGGQLWAHIYIEGVKGITIRSSIFQGGYDVNWKGAGIGIYAVDGGFDLTGRGDASLLDFSYLRNGIQTISTGNGQPFTVKKASFFGNNVGIYNSGVSNSTITFNDFGYLHSFVPNRDQIGIFLEG